MEHQRGTSVLGQQIRRLRKLRGWTQQDLARKSGYCDRLIRKAERGGRISFESLQVLALTLSDAEHQVTAAELSCSSRSSIEYLQNLLNSTLPYRLADSKYFCADDIKVDSRRVDNALPIHGEFVGQSAFASWCDWTRQLTGQQWLEPNHCVSLLERTDGFIHVQFRILCEENSKLSDNKADSITAFDFDMRVKLRDYRIAEIVVLSDLKSLCEELRKRNLLQEFVRANPFDNRDVLKRPHVKSQSTLERPILHGS